MIYAFETDTVWGFGVEVSDKNGIDEIYELKNRDRSKPLILMSSRVEYLLPYVQNVPKIAHELMQEHFPGALTLILEKSFNCPEFLNPEFKTIGIRVPNHKGFSSFCGEKVLATTSANISNETPCQNEKEVIERFGNNVQIVGFCDNISNLSSTIVAFEGEKIKILRQGDKILFAN